MKYCKYHPLQAATFSCSNCVANVCDVCIDDAQREGSPQCILCHTELESLGAFYTSEPFWRRLEESFRYPLNAHCLSLIAAVSFISALVSAMQFLFLATFIIYSIVVGGMMKYCFSCLENTALGNMLPPDIAVAYSGGVKVMFHLLLMMIFVASIIAAAATYLGQAMAGLVGIIMLMGIPAMLINYALSQSVLGALNVINMLRLMISIGLPYGLLIGFIVIMVGSVGVLNQLVGNHFAFFSGIFQSIIAYYYMVVIFHIMGYMIFQYQSVLGFTARREDGIEAERRSEINRHTARINVYLKEGKVGEVNGLFQRAVDRFPGDIELLDRRFAFLIHSKSIGGLKEFAEEYFQAILDRGNMAIKKICDGYIQLQALLPGFVPESPEIRYALAREFLRRSDPAKAVNMIRGMHRQHRDYPHLADAHEVMADALDLLPGMEENAIKCRALVDGIRAKSDASGSRDSRARFPVEETAPGEKLSSAPLETSRSKENKMVQGSAPTEPDDLPPIEFK